MSHRVVRRGMAFLAGLLGLSQACWDFSHANPYDPSAAVSGTLSGPDSSFSINDTLQFSLQTSVELPDLRPTWTADVPDVLVSIGSGRYVTRQSAGARSVTAIVFAGPHHFEHRVELRQRVARLLDCPSAAPYRSPLVITQPTSRVEVCFKSLDARGNDVVDVRGPFGTFVSRDSAVARPAGLTLTGFAFQPVANGSTWLVLIPAAGVPDSVRVTVQR